MTEERSVDYELLGAQLEALLQGETDALANSANFVGLVYNALPDINRLDVGQVLRIPPPGYEAPSPDSEPDSEPEQGTDPESDSPASPE